MAEHYEHGKMDITDQQKTFDGFMWLLIRGSIVILIVLVFLALLNA